MNIDQLQQLKTMVMEAGDLPDAAKSKLLDLLDQTETAQNTTSPANGGGEFLSSVEELEAAHPEATTFMGRLATTLANMGI